MPQFDGKKAIVVGASRGIGREIVKRLATEGAEVLAIARGAENLAALSAETPGIETLAADMADPGTPAKAFGARFPDFVVIAGGATPPMSSFHELSWQDFSTVWNTDTQATFHFCKQALKAPLAPGSKVVALSSGAALGGSPASGGYAGAKRMQMFLANYGQNESERENLGVRFASLVVKQIMGETELGRAAAEGYAARAGISVEEFLGRFDPYMTPADVAQAVLDILSESGDKQTTAYAVSGAGLETL